VDLYSACETSKVLRCGSHSFTCKQHHAYLYFLSIHQMVPPLLVITDIYLQLATYLSTPKDEKLSWPGWLTYSVYGLLT